MSPKAPPLRLAFFLLAAFVVHAAFVGDIAVHGARPDLGLTSLLICCLFVDAPTCAWLGLMAGALEASYTNRYVGSFIVSRTLIGFVLGSLEERIFRDNILIAIAAAVLGTMATESLFFLFAPQPHALRWLVRTGQAALYNGILSVPLYPVIRRLAKRKT